MNTKKLEKIMENELYRDYILKSPLREIVFELSSDPTFCLAVEMDYVYASQQELQEIKNYAIKMKVRRLKGEEKE
ncbi:MAG: hypothetical protein EHM20_02005 [Alphaproteobacteria bacterium]|nr:MAG: hypothetical protein EHM20_02005 [Alphaproteobacteria bacterium]